MADHTLGTIRGTIEIDYDGAGIVRAVRDTDKAKKSMGGLDEASSKILGAFGKFAGGASKVASGISLVTNGVHLLVGVLATVGPLAAAAFATAPGVILGFASALVVTKIAIAGVGDALKAASGDAKKFDEAIKGLSPEAQKFAKAFRAALPQLNAIKKSIQDAFFRNTAGQVGGVVKQVSQLGVVASGVARAISQVVQNVVKFATSQKSIGGLKAILGGVRDFIYQIHAALGPVVQAFIILAAQASGFGGTVGGVVADAFAKLAGFIEKIDLKSLFATALPIIKSFASFFADVGTIAAQVFSIFSTDGGNAAGILAALADQLAKFLQSADGQAAIQALGTALQTISTGAGQVFLALLQALAPAIVALLPGVVTLTNQLVGVLVPAINALNPLLSALAGFLSENMSWLGPLAGVIVAVAAGYKVYAAAATAVAAVQGVLASEVIANTAAWVANAAAIVAARIGQLANAAVMGGVALSSIIVNTAAIVANRVATLAGAAAMAVIRAATIAWTAVQWLLNAALEANPIGLVVLAIAALVAGFIYAYKHSETFRNIVNATWAAIKAAILAVVNWIVNTAWPAIKAAWDAIIRATANLLNWIRNAWNNIKSFLSGVWNAIKSTASVVWGAIVAGTRAYINAIRTIITAGINAAKAVWNAVLNAIKAVARAVWSAIVADVRSKIAAVKAVIAGIKVVVGIIRNAFNSAKSAASNALSSLVSLVRSIPHRISAALGGLGSLLYSKGQSLVRGFINGIASMIGAVKAKASSIVHAVTDFLPGSPAKEGPLSGKGYVLLRARRFMNDFAQGIEDGSQKPSAALLGAVNPVARSVVPSTSRTKSGASSVSTPTTPIGGTREYHLDINGDTLTTLVVDAISGNPLAVKKAADRGAQLKSWSGSGRK